MTVKRYLADPKTLSGTVTVTQIVEGERLVVRLNETWFHPQGGGQKADIGTIGPVQVTHVAHHDGDVDHIVTDVSVLKIGETYPFQINAEARRINAAYHSAGHLIAGIVETLYPSLRAISGHQWPGEARVEFEGVAEDPENLKKSLEEKLREHCAEATPVCVIGDPFNNRAIQIGDSAPVPCGGTHVASVDQIGAVKIDAIRKKGDKTRISYSIE